MSHAGKKRNETTKEKAVRILFENGAFDDDFDIIHFCSKFGISIRSYYEGEGLIKALRLEFKKKRNNGFMFSFNGKEIIFYDDELNQKEMHFIIAHELGHFLMQHSEKNKWNKLKYEREANIFANECMKLMYPDSPNTKRQIYFKMAKIVVSISVILIIGFTAACMISGSNETVYMTKSGDKYHRADCMYINDREMFSLTISEAKENDYLPCKFCRPDEK